MKLSPLALAQWISLGEQAVAAGIRLAGIITQIKAQLGVRGHQVDTEALDALIADATLRAEAAERGTR